MALIKCKSCGHVMSDRAEFCPHCGCPKEFCIKEETSIKEDTPAKEESSAITPKEVSMPEISVAMLTMAKQLSHKTLTDMMILRRIKPTVVCWALLAY